MRAKLVNAAETERSSWQKWRGKSISSSSIGKRILVRSSQHKWEFGDPSDKCSKKWCCRGEISAENELEMEKKMRKGGGGGVGSSQVYSLNSTTERVREKNDIFK